MAQLLIKSQNVRGLVDDRKRREVFFKLNKSKYNVFFLQETHSDSQCEQQWHSEFGGDIIFSHGTRASRGTCILFKKSVGKEIHSVITDNDGRYVIVDVTFGNTRLTLVSIYGPNSDDSDFFLDLIEHVEGIENDNRVIGGDWNVMLDIHKDKRGGLQQTHQSSQNIILNWMEETDLVDIWRLNNPQDFRFTWKRTQPPPGIYCRLDYFLLSFGLIDKTLTADIVPGYKSDHSAIILVLNSNDHPRGPGFWRLNCSYLADNDYVILVKKTISETVDLNQEADASLLWDTIKCQIRGASIKFSSNKKQSKKNKIDVLERRINNLEKQVLIDNDVELQTVLANAKTELEQYVNEATQGAIIRARVRWYEEGEKSSRYFINLEKRNHNNKTLSSLEMPSGDIISDPDKILNQQKLFYQKLYKSTADPACLDGVSNFVSDVNIPQITDETKQLLNAPITVTELSTALKDLPNGKSPGIDGLPSEFYKLFWEDICKYYFDALLHSFVIGKLSITQRQGSIVLIPKKDKNPRLLKNWRPLSLMNCDYKIVAKAIANRIKSCLPDIIHTDQTGFMKNRFIGENIVKILNIMEYTEKEGIPALLMLVDFEKAFDHLEWHFIQKALSLFNFGNYISKWVQTLYNNISSCVGNNGWFSDFFDLSRGVRQGCPLSPYLFIICTEILAISVRANQNIKGVKVNGEETKLSQFADDTTFILLYDSDTLKAVLDTLDQFYICSGLKINYDKTEILRIGSLKHSLAKLYTQKDLKWTNGTVDLLGIKICHDLEQLQKVNYDPLLAKIGDLIRIWHARKLTLFGKITIIQTLLVSQLVYKMSVLPSPSPELMKDLENFLLNFLWNDKKHYLNKNLIKLDIYNGGIKMTDLKIKNSALKIAWLGRLHSPLDAKWKNIARFFLPEEELLFFNGNLNRKDSNKLIKNKSIFWLEVVNAWADYNFCSPNHIEDILGQQIWFNSHIQVKKLPVYHKALHEAGITYIKDIVNNDYVLGTNSIIQKYSLNTKHAMSINGIVSAIPHSWKEVIKESQPNLNFEVRMSSFQKAIKQIKISKFIYWQILNKQNKFDPSNLATKWSSDLNSEPQLRGEDILEAFTLVKKMTISPKHRDFQFRLIHRILVTNKSLLLWKLKDSDLCTFCETEIESIYHLLWGCTYSKSLWSKLFEWIQSKTDMNISYSVEEIFFGITMDNMQFLNCLFVITKQYIYSSRCLNIRPNFEQLVSKINYNMAVEKYIAIKNEVIDKHMAKWGLFIDNI